MTRWLVDGTNVMGARRGTRGEAVGPWWRRDRDAGWQRLVAALARVEGEVRVVFDGRGHEVDAPAHVEVAWAPEPGRDAADRVIAALAAQDADPASLTVVTSDAALAAQVRTAGAAVVGAGAFRRRWLIRAGSTGARLPP